MSDTELVSIDVDLSSLRRWSAQAISKQIPFATAKVLTLLAQRARDEVRADLPKHFKIRSSFTARGITILRAEKRDYPASRAIVGARAEYLVLQETGGTKTSSDGERLAIPSSIPAARRGAHGVPKPITPKRLLAGKRSFIQDENVLVRDRYVKGFIGPIRPPATYYFLRPSARIRPRLEFRETVLKSARAGYAPAFVEALQSALSRGLPRG